MLHPQPYSLQSLIASMDLKQPLPRKLTEQISPVLPKGFDKSLLPQDLCEKQYLKMADCESRHPIQAENGGCYHEISIMLRCKLKRDTIVFDKVKEWETTHFGKFDRENKQMYLQGLTFKLNRLEETLENTPSIPSTEQRLRELGGEIDQIKWRMRYLNKLI